MQWTRHPRGALPGAAPFCGTAVLALKAGYSLQMAQARENHQGCNHSEEVRSEEGPDLSRGSRGNRGAETLMWHCPGMGSINPANGTDIY